MTQAGEKYTATARTLHWVLSLALFMQIGLGVYMADIPKGTPDRSWYFNLHKSIGLVLAVLIFYRLWWRSRNTPPPLSGSVPSWEARLARLSHWLLYACMVVMPISGYIGSNFTKYGVVFFGIKMPPWGWEDKAIYALFSGIHEYTGFIFATLIAIHVLAALKHWLWDKDRVLQRMLP